MHGYVPAVVKRPVWETRQTCPRLSGTSASVTLEGNGYSAESRSVPIYCAEHGEVR